MPNIIQLGNSPTPGGGRNIYLTPLADEREGRRRCRSCHTLTQNAYCSPCYQEIKQDIGQARGGTNSNHQGSGKNRNRAGKQHAHGR